jgi:hypothetical protein
MVSDLSSAPLAAIQYQRGFDIDELLSKSWPSCGQSAFGLAVCFSGRQASRGNVHPRPMLSIYGPAERSTFGKIAGPARLAAASTNVA